MSLLFPYGWRLTKLLDVKEGQKVICPFLNEGSFAFSLKKRVGKIGTVIGIDIDNKCVGQHITHVFRCHDYMSFNF